MPVLAAKGFASHRRAFTLIELMVVLVIVMLLAGMLLSYIRPAVEQRRMRESARMLTTMLYHAKARAIESGRPYGIWIERVEDSEGNQDTARNVFFAEAPAEYSGDTEDARAEMTGEGSCRLTGANSSLIKPGDIILFNFQEPGFNIASAEGGTVQFSSETVSVPKVSKDKAPGSVPFQILRRPRRALNKPLQLSGDIIIDLSQSGTGIGRDFSFQQAKGKQIIIMFSPTGSLDRLFKDNNSARVPASTVHLLLGRNEKRGEENLRNPENLWVSVSPQAGNIATNPNVPANAVNEARKMARSMRTSGR